MTLAADSSDALPIRTLVVVGTGLIGGSLAAALRAAGAVDRVIGVGRRADTLEQARRLGLIDEAADIATATAQADFIFLSTPVGALEGILRAMAPHLRADAVVTDGGSTKQDVVAAARAALGDRIGQFVPGHPIAGSDRHGPDAADAALYRGRRVILTPLPENDAASIARVRQVWRACGAALHEMTPAAHDHVFASVSHLPHLLAFAYMNQVAAAPDAAARLALAGTGFRDFTRIAGSSAEMWRDILLSNRDAVLAELAQVQAVLANYSDVLAQGDAATLERLLDDAAGVRRAWHPAADPLD